MGGQGLLGMCEVEKRRLVGTESSLIFGPTHVNNLFILPSARAANLAHSWIFFTFASCHADIYYQHWFVASPIIFSIMSALYAIFGSFVNRSSVLGRFTPCCCWIRLMQFF